MKIIIPGVPIPKARPRVGKHGAYTPQRTAQYERLVAGMALIARQESHERLWTGPVSLKVTLFPDRVEVFAGELGGKARTAGADISNILKSIEDGLQGVIFKNDRQVEYLTVELMK